jgi:hypothetical protein
MLHIDTDANPIDIVKAIDTVTNVISRLAQERNQFASSIMQIDLDAAEESIAGTEKQLAAARTLLNLALDIAGIDEVDLPPE